MDVIAPVRHQLHDRRAHGNLLAQARVRSWSARPVGPMKVRRAQVHSTHHQ